jgi:peptide-methionine (S)-S-oxide reductase
MKGVKKVVVGYTGGEQPNPTYQTIKDSTEAVLIEYDPEILSYEELLIEWKRQHYPFHPSKTQYRSAIWVRTDEEKAVAEKVVNDWALTTGKKVYTDIELVTKFYQAEEYHQNFLEKQKNSRSFLY